jgi:hypothetical protein
MHKNGGNGGDNDNNGTDNVNRNNEEREIGGNKSTRTDGTNSIEPTDSMAEGSGSSESGTNISEQARATDKQRAQRGDYVCGGLVWQLEGWAGKLTRRGVTGTNNNGETCRVVGMATGAAKIVET